MSYKKSRSISRKLKRSHKRKTYRKRGGRMIEGAPLHYKLSNSWPSSMSLGQGSDYLKYHEGQHGGYLSGAPLDSIGADAIPSSLRGPAHIGGIDKAFEDIKGLSDQAGGRRKKYRRGSKRRGSKRQVSKRRGSKRRATHRRRGGSHLGYASFPNKGMLLDSSSAYDRAGLNPEWKTDVAFADAKIRSTVQ